MAVNETRAKESGGARRAPGEPLGGAVEVDFEPGLDLLGTAARRFTEIVRAVDKPDERARGLEWTVAEVAAHVLQVFRYDLDNVRGTGEPYPVIDDDFIASGTAHGKRQLEQEPERDPGKLAEMIDAVVAEFLDEARGRHASHPVQISSATTVTLATLIGILLGEAILHGHDIAQTIGKSLTIDPEAARQAVYSTARTLVLAVNEETTRDLDVRLETRIRGGKRYVVHIDHGTARTEPSGGKVDLVMSADPVAFLLVGYGRTSPWPQVLKGKMLAWGSRPSLAAKLPVFFRNP